jgi:hypothetical protein
MTRVEIEQKIHFQKEKIDTLERELQAEREELLSLYGYLEESLREELTDVLVENESLKSQVN